MYPRGCASAYSATSLHLEDTITDADKPNEHDETNGRPTWWAGREGMAFYPLSRFIRDALRNRHSAGSDTDIPRNKAQFLMAWELLRERHEAEKWSPPNPLEAAYAKRKRTQKRLDNAPGDPTVKKRHVSKMKLSLQQQDRKIAELEASGIYSRNLSADRWGVLWKLRGDIERAFEATPTGRIHWRALPPDEATNRRVREHHEGLQREGNLKGFDQERLEKALDLPWEKWYVGSDGFDGYSIFTFVHTDKALMECPIYGNALFVIASGWESWSRKSKQELRADASGAVVRIVHNPGWHEEVKQVLGIN